MTLTDHLARLDAPTLTALLERRADVLVEPAPRSVRELAQRLGADASLVLALERVNADEVAVIRAVALGTESVAGLAGCLRSPVAQVRSVVDGLAACGLAWRLDDQVGLPARLAEHFAADLAAFPSFASLAGRARVDELRIAVAGLGGDPEGLRKPELVDRLAALYGDAAVVGRAVAALSPSARAHLDLVRRDPYGLYGNIIGSRASGPVAELTRAGVFLATAYTSPALPREVAAALLQGGAALRGEPELPVSGNAADDGRAAAESALLALTTLLDEADHRPLAGLKKGGIGARERARLSGKVGVTEPALWIDVAAAAGLLARRSSGYGTADEYEAWREEPAPRRWARAALGWFALNVAPTSRETDDGEVAPPLPMESAAGTIRRALLRAAARGRSVAAAASAIDWFCPLHPYTDAGLRRTVAAARHEAALLGVVAGDRLTVLGEHLVAAADAADPVETLAAAVAKLLPAARGKVVLQSDLTAIVSGQPSTDAARVLAAAATPESRGVATTWRFSPASVRAALDAGWTAETLASELAAATDRPLPQPLEYLLTDVARRHGTVRVRGARCCVCGPEADIAEILATRSLQTLHLSRVAPTVLVSPFELDEVVARLRKAGFAPMPEDASGAVILPSRPDGEAGTRRSSDRIRPRRRIPAAELVARLRSGAPAPASPSFAQLSLLAPQLAEAEVALLADALDHAADVRISYRNRAGNRSVRTIRPEVLDDRWMTSWCHLRGAPREFAVAGIESVSPMG